MLHIDRPASRFVLCTICYILLGKVMQKPAKLLEIFQYRSVESKDTYINRKEATEHNPGIMPT